MDNAIDNYQAVLRDLELKRSRLQAEIDKVDAAIKSLRSVMAPNASLFVASPVPALPNIVFKPITIAGKAEISVPPRFAGMSVRWAILKFLAENTGAHPTAAEIAQALIDGAISVGKGKDFASNVSAVLSDMKNKRSEVTNVAGTWALTATGRQAWEAIMATPQYRERASAAASTLQ